MASAVSFVVLLSIFAIAAGGVISHGAGDFFGGHHFGGDEDGGLEAGGDLSLGAGQHDLKGFAVSWANVHKPKTFTVPVYKHVYQHHEEHHHGGDDDATVLGFSAGDEGLGGADHGGFAAQEHHF